MQLTKTDFIQYQNCPKSIWLLKHKPEKYKAAEFSLFLKKLIEQGAEVEKYAQKLFPGGISLFQYGTPEKTREIIEKHDIKSKDGEVYFQAAFETKTGVFARVDILKQLKDGSWQIYEVKSLSEVKGDSKHNHLKDAAFQKYVLEQCGHKIDKVFIVHLNKDYVRQGEINPFGLLKIADVTSDVAEIYEQTVLEIAAATNLLAETQIDEKYCPCRENTRSNHCDSFDYFNPDVPEYSIYEIGNIRKTKIQLLLDAGILKIADINADFGLNDRQILQVESAQKSWPLIDKNAVKELLAGLKFPLHFIDYETFSNAVPRIDRIKPYQHVPFQVSIHSLAENGELKHFEFLNDKMELPVKMFDFMTKATGQSGTFISWNKSFEQGRNNEMAELLPEFAQFLKYMNHHMFDLQDVFKGGYTDYRFHGSTSIKAVLPVLLPQMSYSNLAVRDGTMAMDTWERMVSDPKFSGDKEKTKQNLLKYCRQDTLAMAEIYRKLKE